MNLNGYPTHFVFDSDFDVIHPSPWLSVVPRTHSQLTHFHLASTEGPISMFDVAGWKFNVLCF